MQIMLLQTIVTCNIFHTSMQQVNRHTFKPNPVAFEVRAQWTSDGNNRIMCFCMFLLYRVLD